MGFIASLTRMRAKKSTKSNPRVNEKHKYRGVQVIGPDAECCEAVNAIEGKRYLSEEAPMLPLSGCAATECRCRYEPFYDRRTEPRRASDVGFDVASQFCQQDNRGGAALDRRIQD